MDIKEQLKQIPKLYSTDGENKKAYLHFTNILGKGDWYVCEYQEIEDDILFFGYVKLFYDEYGMFSLNELMSIPSIVLDEDFKPTWLSEINGAKNIIGR